MEICLRADRPSVCIMRATVGVVVLTESVMGLLNHVRRSDAEVEDLDGPELVDLLLQL